MTQEDALTILKTGANVFLTGEPGAGKTHTINAYVEYLRAHEIEPAITASTGIAATHIGGLTIHSWSGIGIKPRLTQYDIDKIATSEYVSKRVSRTKVLIIDEVSMLSPDTLSSVDAVCREIKRSGEPFGGMQVVFVGDFFQLPPIVKNEEVRKTNEEDLYNQDIFGDSEDVGVSGRFAYSSPAWVRARPLVCYLSEQHRQDDSTFLSILSAIRRNEFGEDHMEHIEKRKFSKEETNTHFPKLFSRNVNVDTVNAEKLKGIKQTEQTYTMSSTGNSNLVAVLVKGCLSPETLNLKIGAEVMFTKNNPKEGYVNGTLGVVIGFSKEGKYPIVQTKKRSSLIVEPMEWMVEENGKVKASISQVPLRLAWAITVHKSQGMSMDKAVMDLSDVFEYGQGYVALSRVRNLSGLYLLGWNARAFEVHPEVLRDDEEFRTLSDTVEATFSDIGKDEIQKMHDNFILTNEGTLVPDSTKFGKLKTRKPSFAKAVAGQAKKNKKEDTRMVTLNLWNEGKDVYEVADARAMSVATIWGHIEDLVEDGQITYPALNRLLTPKLEKVLPEIAEAFTTLDTNKLSPVYEHFKGKYSYDDIRVVKILISQK